MPATLTRSAPAEIRTAAPTGLLHAWHLLSLDAPTVAIVWTAFIARASHVAVPLPELLALFLAVWLLYVADRLLDASSRTPRPTPLSLMPRHHFHHRYRSRFLALATIATIILIPLIVHLPRPDLRLDLTLAAALAVWFLLIHRLVPTRKLPKELTVGLFFAAATLIPTITRVPVTTPMLLAAILFAIVGALNGLYISLWEAAPTRKISQPLNISTCMPRPRIAGRCGRRTIPHRTRSLPCRGRAPGTRSRPAHAQPHHSPRRRRFRPAHPHPALAFPALSTGTPNFNRIARLYRWAEYLTLGPLLERTRLHHLPALAHRQRALILGDGDGRFTAALLTRYPGLSVHAVDLSSSMLALLKTRSPAAETHRLDARTHLPPGPYDLVITHFFLDCLTQPELDSLLGRTLPLLTPNALWLLSEFRTPPGALHWPARLYIRALYLAFRILTGLRTTRVPDYTAAFRSAGLTPIAKHRRLAGILTTELWLCPTNLPAAESRTPSHPASS